MLEHFQNDKSTVFSIVPSVIHMAFPGLYPGDYVIPACYDEKKPEKRIVGAAEHLIHSGDGRPIRGLTPSFQVAKAIVDDYLSGILWSSPTANPGLCWLPQDVKLVDFLQMDQYKEIKRAQKAWFVNICKQTDNEWHHYKSTKVVSDQARFAAKFLGLAPEWLNIETVGFEELACPACGLRNPPTNAVCAGCRCILNEEKYKALKFA